jgi:hypothetical protein
LWFQIRSQIHSNIPQSELSFLVLAPTSVNVSNNSTSHTSIDIKHGYILCDYLEYHKFKCNKIISENNLEIIEISDKNVDIKFSAHGAFLE